jgi:acetyl-CoA acetyltransferase
MSVRSRDVLGGRAAVAGIGATEFSKDSGRSELKLAVEAVRAALDDAGLTPADVDGMVTFTMDTSPEITVAQAAGIGELSFFSRVHYGGGAACATVQQAAMAVATGIADVVVCYRAFNERSGRRFGSGVERREPSAEGAALGVNLPSGLLTPASWVAMAAQCYLSVYGKDATVFGHVAVADRRHAANNPAAYFHGRPITLADHAASRWIVEPLRLLDCCQETDGGQAIVVTSVERARDLRRRPAVITAAAQGAGRAQEQMTSYYRGADELAGLPEMAVVARQLWRTSGLRPDAVDAAVLYDHFTPFVLMQLEEFGFCGRGEAADFAADGGLELGGRLPVNTHGGQLGEAYVHGMNGIAEAVRQVRGTSVNQVPSAAHVLVTAGTGVPTSGLILSADG